MLRSSPACPVSDGKARYNSLFGVYPSHRPVQTVTGDVSMHAWHPAVSGLWPLMPRFATTGSLTGSVALNMSLPLPFWKSTEREARLGAHRPGRLGSFLDALSTKNQRCRVRAEACHSPTQTAIADLTVSAYIESGSTTAGLAGPAGQQTSRRRSIAVEN
jgi:hypothetical protein